MSKPQFGWALGLASVLGLLLAFAAPARAELVSELLLNGDLLDPVSGNNGTFVGGTAVFVEGWDGNPAGALSFDGADDYLRLAHTAGLPLRNNAAFTITMWVKGPVQSDKRIFSEGSSTSNTPLYNVGTANDGASGAVDIFIREDGTNSTRVNHYKTGAAFDDTWHHVAAVDDNGLVKVYVDGVLTGSVSYTRAAMTVDRTAIGAILRAAPGNYFRGAIDDIRLYSHALSLAEIQSLVPYPAGIISRFAFDGDLLDPVSGNDGTFVGGTPVFVEGYDGNPEGALSFDGVDDFVDVLQNAGLPLTDNPTFSIAMWVKGPLQKDKRVFSEGWTGENTPLYNVGTDNTGATGALDLFIRRDATFGTPVNHFKTGRVAYDDTWHHIAVVDDNGVVTLYIDGVEEGGGFTYAREPLTTDTTSIGGILRAAPCCYFTGAIDDVRLYSRVLPAEEVAALVPEPLDCPEEGDTSCTSLEVVGPEFDGPGEWTITATGADGGGDDPLWYTFEATSNLGGKQRIGPQPSNVAVFTFLEGIWNVTVQVDDDLLCRDEPESVCTAEIAIVLAPPQLIAHLSLDGDLLDQSGLGNNGAIIGEAVPRYRTGYDCVYPGAVDFDGSNDFINVAQTDGLPIYNNVGFTVAMWVKGVPTVAQRDRRVFSEAFSGGNNNTLFNIGTDSTNPPTGVVDIYIRRDDGAAVVNHRLSTGTAFDGTWHHIAWVDRLGAAVLYIDGVADATDFSYERPLLTLDTTTVGGILRQSPGAFFPGEIDDVRLYNYALDEAAVQALAVDVPECPQVSVLGGDCNLDGIRDITDVICYVNSLFVGFHLLDRTIPIPPCDADLASAGNVAVLDVTGDGVLNVSDIVSMAHFLFMGGAPPAQGVGCFGLPDTFGCDANAACP